MRIYEKELILTKYKLTETLGMGTENTNWGQSVTGVVIREDKGAFFERPRANAVRPYRVPCKRFLCLFVLVYFIIIPTHWIVIHII